MYQKNRCENIFGALEIVGAKEGKENEERLEKSSVKTKMTYEDYDWFGMLGLCISKQTGAVSDKYIQYHHLKTHPLKKDKLIEVQRHIISLNSATQQEQFDSDKVLV